MHVLLHLLLACLNNNHTALVLQPSLTSHFRFCIFRFCIFRFCIFRFCIFRFLCFDFVYFDFVSFDFVSFDFVYFDFVSFDFVFFYFVYFDFVYFDFVHFDFVYFDFLLQFCIFLMYFGFVFSFCIFPFCGVLYIFLIFIVISSFFKYSLFSSFPFLIHIFNTHMPYFQLFNWLASTYNL